MNGTIADGLVLMAFGLLLSVVGLIWTVDLFGVSDEHARRIAKSPWRRMVARWMGEVPETDDPENLPGMKVGRYVTGVGFMLAGGLVVAGGVAYLLTGGG